MITFIILNRDDEFVYFVVCILSCTGTCEGEEEEKVRIGRMCGMPRILKLLINC